MPCSKTFISRFLCALALAWATPALADVEPPAASAPAAPAPAFSADMLLNPPPLKVSYSGWSAQLYGFIEFDAVHDSTQGLSLVVGNTLIGRPGAFAGDNGQFFMSVQNSRLGLKLGGPDFHGVHPTGVFEMDFLGNEPTTDTEAQLFTNPAIRIRLAYLKLETPIVDVLAGQAWTLFGWQTTFQPNSVTVQGLPGEAYSRTLQFRLSHVFKSSAVNFELAAAAARPPQRDSGTPDGHFGARLILNGWTGFHTPAATASGADGAAIGVSGVVRQFVVPSENFDSPGVTDKATGWGLSVDALIPIIPGSAEHHANALTVTGSFVTGKAIADLYQSLTGGLTMPTAPQGVPKGTTPAPTYSANVDNGLVAFDTTGELSPIEWQSFIVGIQYYLPPSGNLWISANFSQMTSNNAVALGVGEEAKIVDKIQFADANLFWAISPAIRFGFEYAWFNQIYGDGTETHNNRFQLSGYYLF